MTQRSARSTLFPYTTLFRSLVIPPLAPHPEQPHRQLACHSYFGNRMIAAQRQVRVLVSPLLLRSEEHTSELQSRGHLVCRLLLETKKYMNRCDLDHIRPALP